LIRVSDRLEVTNRRGESICTHTQNVCGLMVLQLRLTDEWWSTYLISDLSFELKLLWCATVNLNSESVLVSVATDSFSSLQGRSRGSE